MTSKVKQLTMASVDRVCGGLSRALETAGSRFDLLRTKIHFTFFGGFYWIGVSTACPPPPPKTSRPPPPDELPALSLCNDLVNSSVSRILLRVKII